MDNQHGGERENIAQQYGVDASKLIDFSVNLNPLGPPAALESAVTAGLERVRQYPDSESRHLRRKLAAALGVPEACLIIGNGATELIYLVARALEPKRAGVIQPTFTEYQRSVELVDGRVVHIILSPEDQFRWRESDIREQAQSTDVLFLCNPNNPTGGLVPRDTLLSLAEALPHTWVVVDEAFIDFLPNPDAHSVVPAISHYPNLICLRSLTKIFAIPGLRLGYLVAQPGAVERLKRYKEPWTVNVLASAVGEVVVGDDAYLRLTRTTVATEREFLFSQLRQMTQLRPYPSQAPYLLNRLETPKWTARTLLEKLLSFQLLIRDCSNFVGLTPHFFRVAVREREANQRLIAALKRIMEAGH